MIWLNCCIQTKRIVQNKTGFRFQKPETKLRTTTLQTSPLSPFDHSRIEIKHPRPSFVIILNHFQPILAITHRSMALTPTTWSPPLSQRCFTAFLKAESHFSASLFCIFFCNEQHLGVFIQILLVDTYSMLKFHTNHVRFRLQHQNYQQLKHFRINSW